MSTRTGKSRLYCTLNHNSVFHGGDYYSMGCISHFTVRRSHKLSGSHIPRIECATHGGAWSSVSRGIGQDRPCISRGLFPVTRADTSRSARAYSPGGARGDGADQEYAPLRLDHDDTAQAILLLRKRTIDGADEQLCCTERLKLQSLERYYVRPHEPNTRLSFNSLAMLYCSPLLDFSFSLVGSCLAQLSTVSASRQSHRWL